MRTFKNIAINVCISATVALSVCALMTSNRTDSKTVGQSAVSKFHKASSVKTEFDKILVDILPVIRKREGLKLKPYTDGRFWYIGYGHLVGKSKPKYIITEDQAEEIMINDLIKAYKEVIRVNKENISRDMGSLFTSGKIKSRK